MLSNANTPEIYIGSYGICQDTFGRLLLVRMGRGLDKGKWTLPGGGIEWGEDPDAAMIREMDEETGITDIKNISLREIYSRAYPACEENSYKAIHHLGIIYDLQLGSFDLRVEQDGATDLCQWFDEQQARSLPLTLSGEFAVNAVWRKS